MLLRYSRRVRRYEFTMVFSRGILDQEKRTVNEIRGTRKHRYRWQVGSAGGVSPSKCNCPKSQAIDLHRYSRKRAKTVANLPAEVARLAIKILTLRRREG